jgi:hypothetical protein
LRLRLPPDSLEATGLHGLPELDREEGIAIVDHKPLALEEAMLWIGEVPCHLEHPLFVRAMADAGDVDTAGSNVDHEIDQVTDQASGGPGFAGEEVASRHGFKVRLDERGPVHLLGVLGVVHEAMFDHDPADGLPRNLEPEFLELAVDVTVAPRLVFRFHPQYQIADFVGLVGLGTTFTRAVVLAGHQQTMPPQQGLRRKERCHLVKHTASELGRGGGEAAFLGDVEDQAFAAELLAEDAVFLLQIGDHVLLLTVDEAGEGDE